MGEVYRAVDGELERPVAVKLLAERHAGDEELRQRFAREALAAARLSADPNTVLVYDVGEWRGRPYLVMEYLAGGSLEARLREQGRPAVAQALTWMGEAASALDHAHAQGVVHRDVKPANLLFDADGVLHVADFGIASAAGSTAVTQTGTVLGTAGYLAPEQAEGKKATAAADRYALAVVAFELLTGQRPYRRDSPAAEAAAHLHSELPSISERDAELPVGLDAIFAQALAKSPQARFPSCTEFVQTVRRCLEPGAGTQAGTAATLVGPAAAERAKRERSRPWWLSAVALLAALGAGAALALAIGHAAVGPSVRTVTAAAPPASTVTVTGPATTRAPTATNLTRQGQALIGAGDYQAALPLLQRAVRLLRGTGTPREGQADYDLAYALAQLGNCSSAIPLLDHAQTILGPQPPTVQLLAACTGPPGHQPDHSNGNGNSQS